MRTLTPLSDRFRILALDHAVTEFEIQAWLYAELLLLGFTVRGEACWRDRETRLQCRFDLVILDGQMPVEIIEVKDTVGRGQDRVEQTRQGQRYRHFGVPVTFVYGMDDAAEFLKMKSAQKRIAA